MLVTGTWLNIFLTVIDLEVLIIFYLPGNSKSAKISCENCWEYL